MQNFKKKTAEAIEAAIREIAPDAPLLRVSAKTGEGMETLAREIEKIAYGGEWKGGEASFVADAREADLLRRAASFLSNAAETVETGMGADFIVIDLRSAWESLGEITGETVGEDIIDEIFRRFCIGK